MKGDIIVARENNSSEIDPNLNEIYEMPEKESKIMILLSEIQEYLEKQYKEVRQ
jgi:hypothetical protein